MPSHDVPVATLSMRVGDWAEYAVQGAPPSHAGRPSNSDEGAR